MTLKENFDDFLEAIRLTENQRNDAKTKYEGVCKNLDKLFYNSDYNENHKFIFGSYKTKTNVRPLDEMQDVDLLFKIPKEIREQYKDDPEGLLQKIRTSLKKTYPTTDKISAWGKVVLVKFKEGTHNIEILPALEHEDGKFTIPNTEDGGSWEDDFDPRSEIDSFTTSNNNTGNLTRYLIQMLKKWRRNTSTLNYRSYDIMNDVINFLDSYYKNGLGSDSYEELLKNYFKWKLNKLKKDDDMHSYTETAYNRVLKAMEYEADGKFIKASEEFIKIFGSDFPKSKEDKDKDERSTNSFNKAPRPWAMN